MHEFPTNILFKKTTLIASIFRICLAWYLTQLIQTQDQDKEKIQLDKPKKPNRVKCSEAVVHRFSSKPVFLKLHRKIPVLESLWNLSLKACNFIKKETLIQVFSCKSFPVKFLKRLFYIFWTLKTTIRKNITLKLGNILMKWICDTVSYKFHHKNIGLDFTIDKIQSTRSLYPFFLLL